MLPREETTQMQPTFPGNIEEASEILGVTWSDKNYIRLLWDKYCTEGTVPSGLTDSLEMINDELSAQQETRLARGEPAITLKEILNWINTEERESGEFNTKDKLEWLEEKIAVMQRVNADLDLCLRIATIRTSENACRIT